MKIGTHHGKFHADEVFAVAILKTLHPAASVLRTREARQLATCDIVVDVGGGQYDHHTTDKVYRDNGIPYASAGLIWRDFGMEVLRRYGNSEAVPLLQSSIDEKLFQGIDADDNGYKLEKDFRVKAVSEIIGGFNPPWSSESSENVAFEKAVACATQILLNQIEQEAARLQAVNVVKEAYQRRTDREILVLKTTCPWTETLLNVDTKEEVLFVVFPDRSGGFRLQVVPKELGTFEARKPLPALWAGKEGDELRSLLGIPDAVFCHPARFIAGAGSHDSIMTMARLALRA